MEGRGSTWARHFQGPSASYLQHKLQYQDLPLELCGLQQILLLSGPQLPHLKTGYNITTTQCCSADGTTAVDTERPCDHDHTLQNYIKRAWGGWGGPAGSTRPLLPLLPAAPSRPPWCQAAGETSQAHSRPPRFSQRSFP